MPVFDHSFVVDGPLEAVRAFHGDTSALSVLSPPGTFVRLHAIEPLAEGSVSRFTLWLGPLPVRWTAVHRGVSERGFTDVQQSGPAASWEHTHTFVPLDDGRTRVDDHIEFAHHPGLGGALTRVLFSRPNLHFLFAWRAFATRRAVRALSRRDAGGPGRSRG
jgi:ligand-binding SRPBCC domain-containing protein